MDYETLKVVIGPDRVGIVTMNRPEVRNAMNTKMMAELRDCFAAYYVDSERRGLSDPDGRGGGLLQPAATSRSARA